MPGVRDRGEKIRQFIVDNVETHPTDIVGMTSEKFGITRQAVNAHIRKLEAQKSIISRGSTKNKQYHLHPKIEKKLDFDIKGLEEDVVWRNSILPDLRDLPDNVINIWNYGFTEMLNNAIDHSQGSIVLIDLKRYPSFTEIIINDNGVGIFKKIQTIFGLHDERHAVLELAKGKLTTDSERHSGEGIFFSSRVFDKYAIMSGEVYFSHEHNKPEDWILEQNSPNKGTTVIMKLSNNSSRKLKSVFDEYATGDEYGFDKTVVPVALAKYGNENLISRSQAKRLLERMDRFKIVIFDFEGIDFIGQAFSDEVFRVFQNQHKDIQLIPVNTNEDIKNMINRSLSTL